MLTGQVRPVETRTLEVKGTHDEIVAALNAAAVDGWEVDSITTRRLARYGATTTVEAADIDAVRAKVPDGHQLLSVIAE
ncbi:hypothetical protein ACUOFU_16760 [Microbacterium arabinogalactanolyticum]|uniref:hypothetical protein n=1 Tax=Microbacterium arabinogalactanolyticum TaxID=69365 RepID=UPI004044E656